MSIYKVITSRRTVRKFKQEKIKEALLMKMIDGARLAPSAANKQPLKYRIVNQEEEVKAVFDYTKWAGYIAPDGTPKADEEPVAFIVVLGDTDIRKSGFELDAGAAIQNILLVAKEEGIGSCWIGSINREKIREALNIPISLTLISVIALGYEGEWPVTEDEAGSIKYYKGSDDVLHVPKRKLKDIIVKLE